MYDTMNHPLDLAVESDELSLDLFAEELSPQEHRWSDCGSSASTISTTGTASFGTFFCMGSLTSCGS